MNEQKRDAAYEQAVAAVLGRICNVSNLPDWMVVSALGRNMRPLAELVADALLPLVDTWLAEAEQRVTDAVEAALRLIAPDHITPMGARQVKKAMENVTTRGNR